MKLFIFIIVFANISFHTFAQDMSKSEIYQQQNPMKITIPEARDQKEILYFSDEILKDYDPNLGIMSDSFITLRDRNRLSLGYHLSTNYNDFTEISNLEIEFIQNMRNWSNAWWGVIFKTGSAAFSAIGQNHTSSATADANSNANSANQIPAGANQNLTVFGIGYGHRFRFLLDFVKTERLYEQAMIYFGYMTHSDDFTKKEYSGPALIMDYQLFKRSSHRVYYGAKLSYNLASVTTEIAEDIRNREARLTLSWISLGFTVGYFY